MAFIGMQLMEEGSSCILLELQEEAVLYIYIVYVNELHAIYVIHAKFGFTSTIHLSLVNSQR